MRHNRPTPAFQYRTRRAPPAPASPLIFVAGNKACRDESATNPDVAPFDKLDSFPRWRTETAGLSAIANKLELFDRFGTLEDEIEPLETALQDIVDAISAAGDVAADIARGA